MKVSELIATLRKCPASAEIIAIARGLTATRMPSHAPLIFKPEVRIDEGGVPIQINLITRVRDGGTDFVLLSSEPFELT